MLASYLLAPYRERGGDLPEPTFPYFGEPVDLDAEHEAYLELAGRL